VFLFDAALSTIMPCVGDSTLHTFVVVVVRVDSLRTCVVYEVVFYAVSQKPIITKMRGVLNDSLRKHFLEETLLLPAQFHNPGCAPS
jgi:hypothetical protein